MGKDVAAFFGGGVPSAKDLASALSTAVVDAAPVDSGGKPFLRLVAGIVGGS